MGPAERVFRTRLSLRLLLAGASIFWLALFCALLPLHGIAATALGSCAAFVAFFGVQWAYHARVRIAVGQRVLTYRNLWRKVQVPFEDVLRVEVSDAWLFKLYLVATRRGAIAFSSHVKAHRELFELLLERARLRAPA